VTRVLSGTRYILSPKLGPSLCGSGLYGGYPYPLFLSQKRIKGKCFFQKDNFLFLKQLFYNDSLDETMRWFIDPLAGTLGTFEVETAWVLLRV